MCDNFIEIKVEYHRGLRDGQQAYTEEICSVIKKTILGDVYIKKCSPTMLTILMTL